mmetsp:Transcript_105628/g.147256  ORF Transcript_105628/g.147256 Transcript_105628/m.147256 type:complete len:138 (+) Transcript_105628:70-483(+)
MYGAAKTLSPAMQGKLWSEVISKEAKDHPSHALNTHPSLRRNHLEPLGNRKDFFNNAWCAIGRRYHQAAGCPSPFVDMSRRYIGIDAELPSRPGTGTGFTVSAPNNLPPRPATGSVHSFRSQRSRSSSRARTPMGAY